MTKSSTLKIQQLGAKMINYSNIEIDQNGEKCSLDARCGDRGIRTLDEIAKRLEIESSRMSPRAGARTVYTDTPNKIKQLIDESYKAKILGRATYSHLKALVQQSAENSGAVSR